MALRVTSKRDIVRKVLEDLYGRAVPVTEAMIDAMIADLADDEQ